MKPIVEVCAGSVQDCIVAQEGGADRIELNSGLFLGGLTPSLGALILAKEKVDIPIVAMVRPRGGAFCYHEQDFCVMLEDAKQLCAHGADGIAFGFLHPDRRVDVERTKKMLEVIGEKEAVFHRAFDLALHPMEVMEQLISLGVSRVLTSGQKPTALEGATLLQELQRQYGTQLEILAGCGVQGGNVVELMEKTGIQQVHSSCKSWVEDLSNQGGQVSYGYQMGELEHHVDIVDIVKVRALVEKVK